MADVREKRYNAAGLQDYMFRISDAEVCSCPTVVLSQLCRRCCVL